MESDDISMLSISDFRDFHSVDIDVGLNTQHTNTDALGSPSGPMFLTHI